MNGRELYLLYRTGWIAAAVCQSFEPNRSLPTDGQKAYADGFNDGYRTRLAAMAKAREQYKADITPILLQDLP